jgi:[acyl-carrier-protein] S-malonyltransferase
VDRAADELYAKDIAVKATDLPVWVPFHSSLCVRLAALKVTDATADSMRPAEAGVRLAIDRGITLRKPARHIASCLTGELLSSPEELARALVAQMSRPVQWTQALHALRTRYNVADYVFMGPGKVLANLAKKEVQRGCWDAEGQAQRDWVVGSVTSEEDLRQLRSLVG